MSFTSVQIMSDSSGLWDLVGDATQSSGYYGQTIGLHTVAFSINAFIGRVSVEATLASEPSEEDWFLIEFNGESLPYVEFGNVTTGTFGYTFRGNFTFVRAVMNRTDYIVEPTDSPVDLNHGNIRQVLLNF